MYEYGTTENVKIELRDILRDLHVVPKFDIAEKFLFSIESLFFWETFLQN